MLRRHSIHAALGVVIWLAAACSPSAPSKSAPPPSAAAPRDVAVAQVTEAVWETVLHLTGELVPSEESVLSTKVAGRLESLAVDVGSVVRRGEPIARIEARDFELRQVQAAATLTAARAMLGLEENAEAKSIDTETMAIVREARAELDQARREVERQTSLVGSGAATQSILDTATTAYSAAESHLQEARETIATRRATVALREAELEIARQQLADTQVKAPYDGVVLERLAGTGDYLSAGAPLARLLRNDPVRLRVIVPEQASGLVSQGQELRAQFDSGSASVVAAVTRMAPALGARDRSLVVEADVKNPDGKLRPGSFARAELVLDAKATTLVIPPTALVRFAGIDKVFVDEKDQAVERRVKIGRVETERVEVLEGLAVGDRVVLEPGSLQGGTRLHVKD
ncbi:MAG TPA: efflux RND transporter periplasmic adaptor subunit [Planctomycetota bacterium]|nr:efflux RND transporter periplasmic adaptor subunit [Planctomycetota bacterium]